MSSPLFFPIPEASVFVTTTAETKGVLAMKSTPCVLWVGDMRVCLKRTLNPFGELTVRKGLKRDLVTATAAIAGFSSLLFGFLTNLPVALA
jgi:hypothetical protein